MSNYASEILYLQQTSFCQVASAAALLYDYLLLFRSEVDLIWAREWNLVTLLYAVVRYLSFFLILATTLCNVSWTAKVSLVWFELVMWCPYVYRFAMDIIMMKRIYALSRSNWSFLNSPKWVLGIMLTAFIAKYVLCITFLFLSIGPGSQLLYFEVDFLGTRVCGGGSVSNFEVYAQYPTLGFEILLFVLAFGYFVADVRGSRRALGSKSWKVNDLVQILVRDSTIYFTIIVAAAALNLVTSLTQNLPGVFKAISMALQNFLPYCFAPRLVLNVKEHENRDHLSLVGGNLSDMKFDDVVLPPFAQEAHDSA